MSILQDERTALFDDIYKGICPKRVPVTTDVDYGFASGFAGKSLLTSQYNYDEIEEVFDVTCAALKDADQMPIGIYRFPALYQRLGSNSFVMAQNGYVQHPETSAMDDDEYPELIADPIKFLMEKALPRHNSKLTGGDMKAAKTLMLAYDYYNNAFYKTAEFEANMVEKYEYAIRPGTIGAVVPVDFIAAALRGFTKISIDCRRRPNELAEAAQALLPMFESICTMFPGHAELYLHMAPFMTEQNFLKIYWPTFKAQIEYLVESGQTVRIWCERNWMRYLDYLTELPDNIAIVFEDGDAQLCKDKLGTKKIISGLYPTMMFRSSTTQECVDEAKKIVDILAPGGAYIFGFDKGLLSPGDAKIENVQATLKAVREYGVY